MDKYIITTDELNDEYMLNLLDYAIDDISAQAIIKTAYDRAITAILHFNDNFSYESDIVKALDENENLVKPFKKLQKNIIYNMVFIGDNDPIDENVEKIICFDLKWGKINGWQKAIYKK